MAARELLPSYNYIARISYLSYIIHKRHNTLTYTSSLLWTIAIRHLVFETWVTALSAKVWGVYVNLQSIDNVLWTGGRGYDTVRDRPTLSYLLNCPCKISMWASNIDLGHCAIHTFRSQLDEHYHVILAIWLQLNKGRKYPHLHQSSV